MTRTRGASAASNNAATTADLSPATTATPSKITWVIVLLQRSDGASLAELTEHTGWLPHTVRAALTGLKKKGYSIDSDKVGDVRTYRATALR